MQAAEMVLDGGASMAPQGVPAYCQRARTTGHGPASRVGYEMRDAFRRERPARLDANHSNGSRRSREPSPDDRQFAADEIVVSASSVRAGTRQQHLFEERAEGVQRFHGIEWLACFDSSRDAFHGTRHRSSGSNDRAIFRVKRMRYDVIF
jgi:hypothetical protein